ncbi:DEAD-box ATP-dependent RNA helicase [Chloropicon primus]|uniref:ATP-dependent RNA helicase n=2 Tax=Chloropicon primus TaxID=1764295 RepID=A0A5B8MGE1_9CHLO|nr:DEAD-box ATP-dependent RNA helicase [Chloropicon primus]UPQ98413.1 DEAD-box ATP-dependent RNA helicase [Chloropicon primus]|eukprot:QDZ19204.1 DEAD-box ATP-dependent RNA helicase [Chloropicon primus]
MGDLLQGLLLYGTQFSGSLGERESLVVMKMAPVGGRKRKGAHKGPSAGRTKGEDAQTGEDLVGEGKRAKWKKVEVDQDSFLEEADHDFGGFLELEVLDEGDVGTIDAPEPAKPDASVEDRQKKKKKKKKKNGGDAGEGSSAEARALEEERGKDRAAPAKRVNKVNMKKWFPFHLDARIVDSLKVQGFSTPTPIQKESLPSSLSGEADIVGAAQTGSGKTLAFALPMIQRILREKDKLLDAQALGGEGPKEGSKAAKNPLGVRALVVTPTRELALQITQHIDKIASRYGIYTAGIVGGMSQQKQERVLKNLPHIVVGTPGRLWELIESDTGLSNLKKLSFFVLDEADRMVEQGHFQELSYIIDRVPFSPKLQTFVFSATLTMPKTVLKKKESKAPKKAKTSVASIMKKIKFRENVQIFDLTRIRKVAAKLEETVINCSEESRMEFLYFVLATKTEGRTLVFCNAISTIRTLLSILENLGLPVSAIHAQQQQRQRLKALDSFKNGKKNILLATDVAARGLDIPGVRCVVQYQLPDTSETYVHRAGRTARAEEDGLNILFVVPKNAKQFMRLRYSLKMDKDLPSFPVKHSVMPKLRARVSLAKRIDEITRSDKKQKVKVDWIKRNAEAAGLVVEEEEKDDDDVAQEHLRNRKRQQKLNNLRQELNRLLAKPLV